MEEVTDEPLYRDRVCGIDIGKAELYATIRVPSDKDPARRASETRRFAATKRGVLALADWLRCWQVPAVVMEATLVIRGSNGLKSDIAQVVPSRTRPRREGRKAATTRGSSGTSAAIGCLRRGRSPGNPSATERGTGKPAPSPAVADARWRPRITGDY